MTVDDATNKQWAAAIEALIFASEKPVPEAELRNHIPEDVEEQVGPAGERRPPV